MGRREPRSVGTARRLVRSVGTAMRYRTRAVGPGRYLIGVVAAAVFTPAAQAGPSLPLGHEGRWITDARGRVVVMHGVNMVSKRPPYAPDATGFGGDDARFLAPRGLHTIRLGVIYSGRRAPARRLRRRLPRPPQAERPDRSARHGIVTMVDFHQDLYNERYPGEGWPDWAVM